MGDSPCSVLFANAGAHGAGWRGLLAPPSVGGGVVLCWPGKERLRPGGAMEGKVESSLQWSFGQLPPPGVGPGGNVTQETMSLVFVSRVAVISCPLTRRLKAQKAVLSQFRRLEVQIKVSVGAVLILRALGPSLLASSRL